MNSPTVRSDVVESSSVDVSSSRSGLFAASVKLIPTTVTACGEQGEHRCGQHEIEGTFREIIPQEHHTTWPLKKYPSGFLPRTPRVVPEMPETA